ETRYWWPRPEVVGGGPPITAGRGYQVRRRSQKRVQSEVEDAGVDSASAASSARLRSLIIRSMCSSVGKNHATTSESTRIGIRESTAPRVLLRSAITPNIGNPNAPAIKPSPSRRPDATPARPAINCCAITSNSGDDAAERMPSTAPETNPKGPGNVAKIQTTG